MTKDENNITDEEIGCIKFPNLPEKTIDKVYFLPLLIFVIIKGEDGGGT